MGNSKTTISSISYTDQNNKNVQLILDMNGISQAVKDKISLLRDFCNENNLEMLDAVTGLVESDGEATALELLRGGWDPIVRIKDPETGVEYTFDYIVMNDYEPTVNRPHFTRENIVQNFKTALNEFKTIKKSTNPEFTENVKRIHFDSDISSFGSFNDFDDPFGINISAMAFEKLNGTYMTGTMVHEIAHLWEHNNYGLGGLKQFSERDSYPCKYASKQYSDGTKPECLSTTIEQIYTHKLRNDALMKNGKPVVVEFISKYKRMPKSNSTKDMEKMYGMWYDDWYDPLGKEAENILGM